MLVLALSLGATGVLILLVWLIRGGGSDTDRNSIFHRLDTEAFRNLLSRADEQYLRASLTSRNYHRVRKARLRAVQEYLIWIAEDCVVLLAEIHAAVQKDSSIAEQSQAMVRQAIKLRTISLAFWALLWVEYLIPSLEIKPLRALRKYEELRRATQQHFLQTQVQATGMVSR